MLISLLLSVPVKCPGNSSQLMKNNWMFHEPRVWIWDSVRKSPVFRDDGESQEKKRWLVNMPSLCLYSSHHWTSMCKNSSPLFSGKHCCNCSWEQQVLEDTHPGQEQPGWSPRLICSLLICWKTKGLHSNAVLSITAWAAAEKAGW